MIFNADSSSNVKNYEYFYTAFYLDFICNIFVR